MENQLETLPNSFEHPLNMKWKHTETYPMSIEKIAKSIQIPLRMQWKPIAKRLERMAVHSKSIERATDTRPTSIEKVMQSIKVFFGNAMEIHPQLN